MALICALAIGLIYVRLQFGGLSLAALKPAIETALASELGDRNVQFETAELTLDDELGLVAKLTQVTINDADGRPLVLAPSVRAALSVAALRRGRLALQRLDIVGPRITAITTATGGLAVAIDNGASRTRPDRGAVNPGRAQTQEINRPLDVVKLLTAASARARRRETVTGYLREIGLKQAVLIVGDGVHSTVWNVPDLQVDLTHRRAGSSVTAKATIATLAGPINLLIASTETDRSEEVAIDVSFEGFNPHGVARLVPGLGIAERIDLPMAGQARILLSIEGQIKALNASATAQKGEIRFGLLGRKPVSLEPANLVLAYDSSRGVIDVSDLSFGWAGNKLSLVGQVTNEPNVGWSYALQSTSGMLAPPRPDGRGVKIDGARFSGRYIAATQSLGLQDLTIRAANADVTAKGEVSWATGHAIGQIDGRLSPMSADALKAVWPSVIAPGVRSWVAAHVTKGQLAGGLFKALIEPARGGSKDAQARLSLTLEASGLEVQTVKGMPPLEIPRGLVRVEGETIEITSPEVNMTASEGRRLQLRAARFTAVETAVGDQPTAEVAFRLNGPVAAAAELADREPLQLLRSQGVVITGLDGKLDGQLKVVFPLADNLQFSEVKSEGRLRVTDLRARQVFGAHDVSGGTINVDVGDKVVDVKGDLLVKGVNSKLNWIYQLHQAMAQQPPLRLTTTLDTADRATLGLDTADLVQGETPVEVLVSFAVNGQPQPRVRIDLTKAELTFDAVAWRKAPGRSAVLQFDPVRGPGSGAAQRLELQNMRLVGDDIALEGWMAIGPDNKPREFSFPELTLNLVSRLSAHGKRRPDNVWDITAKGPTFDGRDVFRTLFSLGQTRNAVRKDKPGLDITADIDTVIGFSDTTVKNVRLKLSERGERMTELDVKATLASGKPFAALLRNQTGVGRQLLAEGADAGQVFKVVGFYPSAVGGLMQLEVNLDAKGVNEKSGTLWARDFAVLGDSIVGDVVQSADATPGQGPNQPRAKSAQRVQRQQFDFDGMRIPFDVGAGQFVMNNAVLRGPVIGATFRGKIDFKQQTVNLGGTYVPLSGLNVAIGGILGPLSGGPQGEGLFGITFAVQGNLANPQVIVNPLSLLGPGIFREIFQLTPETFKVTPRSDAAVAAPVASGRARGKSGATGEPSRSSSAPAAEPRIVAPPSRSSGEVLPDWTSDVKVSPKTTP